MAKLTLLDADEEMRIIGDIGERLGMFGGKLVCGSSENRERTGDSGFMQEDC